MNGPQLSDVMSRTEQAAAIWDAIGLYLINEQFSDAVRTVMRLAALAFADTHLGPCRLESLEGWAPSLWGHVKGQLEIALNESGIPAEAQREWRTAFEAVYRIGGGEEVVPCYEGFL